MEIHSFFADLEYVRQLLKSFYVFYEQITDPLYGERGEEEVVSINRNTYGIWVSFSYEKDDFITNQNQSRC
jgi:hypothetical protein